MRRLIKWGVILGLMVLIATPLEAWRGGGWDNLRKSVSKFITVEKSADAVTLTVAECSKTLVTNRGWDGNDDQTFTLPASKAGLKFKFLAVKVSTATADTYIDTEGSTTNIYLDGIAVGDSERVYTQEVAVGEGIVCHTFTIDGTTYDWACDSVNGTWEDAGS